MEAQDNTCKVHPDKYDFSCEQCNFDYEDAQIREREAMESWQAECFRAQSHEQLTKRRNA